MLKVTISLEEDIVQFVDQYAQGNRSAYINTFLAEHRRRILAIEMIAALKQDAEDAEYQAEIAASNSVAGDGINARAYYNTLSRPSAATHLCQIQVVFNTLNN